MIGQSIIKPKTPNNASFVPTELGAMFDNGGYPALAFTHNRLSLYVISALEVAKDGDGSSNGPEYHISVTKQKNGRPRRVATTEMELVLAAFDMKDALEDNHVPFGKARNYWLPVNENLIGKECPCVDEETAFVEDKGEYIWRGINT